MTRTRYGLQRDNRWLMPPAFDLKPSNLTDDPSHAWVAFTLDAAKYRQDVLRQAFGITTTIRLIPHD